MTLHDTSPHFTHWTAPGPWVSGLLGAIMILAGIFVLGDVVLVTIISTIFIGALAIIAGAFEVVHAFWAKSWGGLAWQIILGLLYVAFGLALFNQPVTSALVLTYVFGLLLVVSGIVRIALGVVQLKEADWTMLLSGIFGTAAGVIILTGWPVSGLWVIGFLLGIDLILHGVAWLAYAWHPTARTA